MLQLISHITNYHYHIIPQKKDSPPKGRALLYNIYRYILSEERQQDTSSNGRTDYT